MPDHKRAPHVAKLVRLMPHEARMLADLSHLFGISETQTIRLLINDAHTQALKPRPIPIQPQ